MVHVLKILQLMVEKVKLGLQVDKVAAHRSLSHIPAVTNCGHYRLSTRSDTYRSTDFEEDLTLI